jgi:hypothetical protein
MTKQETKPNFSEWMRYIRMAANKKKHHLSSSDLITKFTVKINYEI